MALEELPNLDPLLLPAEPPPNSGTPQDFGTHPGLAQLLQNLGVTLGGDGLSPHLQQELNQARGSLRAARELWMPLELLRNLLGELSRDPGDFDPSGLLWLQGELTWAQVRRGPPSVSRLLPPRKVPQVLPGLLPELQLRLREKRQRLRHFLLGSPKMSPFHPKTRAPSPPKIAPDLGQILRCQRLRLLRERLRERRLRDEMDATGWKYTQVLSRCLSRLSQLCSLRLLQAHLDRGRGQYLQVKGGASLLKARLEELRVLLDTYPSPTIQAHQRIRALLSESRRAAEAQAAILGAELAALRALGPEFRKLALELGQIRQESAQKRWALLQLRPTPP